MLLKRALSLRCPIIPNVGASKKISVTNVHLDLGAGRRGTSMGPSAIHLAGLVPRIHDIGHEVHRTQALHLSNISHSHLYLTKDDENPSVRYLNQVLDVCRNLKFQVLRDLRDGVFPLILGGDHSLAMGSIAGVASHFEEQNKPGDFGVVWVDAHTDMNTPESSPSGNIHGMPLAVACGVGHPELLKLNPTEGKPAVDPKRVVLLGIRDVDPTEVPVVEQLGVRCITMSEIDHRGATACFEEAIAIASGGKPDGEVHLSFDLDGLDPTAAPGVGTAVPGGLTVREAHLLLEMIPSLAKLCSMEIVELNPTLDDRNKTGKLAVWLVESALGRGILGTGSPAQEWTE